MTIAATKKHQFEMAPQGKFTNFYNLIFFSLIKNSFRHRQNLNYLCNRGYLGEKNWDLQFISNKTVEVGYKSNTSK